MLAKIFHTESPCSLLLDKLKLLRCCRWTICDGMALSALLERLSEIKEWKALHRLIIDGIDSSLYAKLKWVSSLGNSLFSVDRRDKSEISRIPLQFR